MTLVNAYCTVDQLREHFGDAGEQLSEAILERAINSTSRAIDNYCGAPLRRFWQSETTVVLTYRPDLPDLAWVHDFADTASLAIKTDTSGDGTFATTWSASDYELEPANADQTGDTYAYWRIRAVGTKTFPVGTLRRSLQLTVKPGWSAIPYGVEQACILRSAAMYQRREAIFGVAGGFEVPVRITRADPDVIALLGDYIRYDMRPVG